MTGMHFPVERVGRENFSEFLYLLEKLAVYEQFDPPGTDARLQLETDALMTPPKYEAYIERFDGEPVGFVTFFFSYSTFIARPILFIEDLFVLEAFRKQGFGGKLFDFCQNEARARGCGRMEWRVLNWNEPSIAFYEKCGAERLPWYPYRLELDRS
jgi:GNAT superfamily N-acetyltransferase